MKSRIMGPYIPFLVAGLLWSCSLSDKDRCPSGFAYVPELKACQAIPDASAPAPDATATLPSSDTGVSEAASGPIFGSTCAGAGDCQSSITDYCVLNPGASSGYCSKADCHADCPSDYKCCNCPAFSLVACFKNMDATQMTALGCTCS